MTEAKPTAIENKIGGIAFPLMTNLFLLFSLCDVLLTWYLMRHGVREGNPIALYFINEWNIRGMVVFKAIIVASAVILIQAVALQRPHLSRAVLIFACIATGGVVIYSCCLITILHTGWGVY